MGSEDLVASAVYQPEPTAAAAARRFVRSTLQAWAVAGAAEDGHGLVDDAVLLTSELVTNAVVHAGTPVRVTCRLESGAVEVVVTDGQPTRLVLEATEGGRDPAERTSGRGLLLPAALASSWGVTYDQAAKAVWFRLGLAAAAGLGAPVRDPLEAGEAGGAVEQMILASALRSVTQAAVVPPRVSDMAMTAAPDHGEQARGLGEPDYQHLLTVTAEAARADVGADVAVAVMVDEEGDLRLRAVAGTLPVLAGDGLVTSPDIAASLKAAGRAAMSVVTVPFIVDGRVTGLLTAVSARSAFFGDADTLRLQALADGRGPILQRVWLREMERVRRGRIAALAEARGLLTGGLGEADVMALAGRVTVPRLAPWCAVLVAEEGAELRPAHVRPAEEAQREALTWLLDGLCRKAQEDRPAWHEPGAGLGRRWPFGVIPGTDAPPGAAMFAGDSPWCFPFGTQAEGRGMFVIGSGGHRLPREVTALGADIACRIGLALGSSRAAVGG